MRALFAVTVYCISLLSSQLLAVPVCPSGTNRLDFMARSPHQSLENIIAPAATEHANTERSVSIDRTVLWRAILSRPPPATSENHIDGRPMGGESNEAGGVSQQRASRGRRHALLRNHHNHHHAKLMRVGCVLGTCQVQNLSHRLFQLAGQSGREDSAPINPRSPHSYG